MPPIQRRLAALSDIGAVVSGDVAVGSRNGHRARGRRWSTGRRGRHHVGIISVIGIVVRIVRQRPPIPAGAQPRIINRARAGGIAAIVFRLRARRGRSA